MTIRSSQQSNANGDSSNEHRSIQYLMRLLRLSAGEGYSVAAKTSQLQIIAGGGALSLPIG